MDSAMDAVVLDRDHAHEASGVVVVIDVLRAFTTGSLAASNGVPTIHLVADPADAFALRDAHPDVLLMGEEGGLPIDGFDLSNSPVELIASDVRGRELVHRTSSGTRAAVAAFAGADRLYCASLLSAVATAQAIGEDTPTYVVSGRSAERAAFDDGDDDLAVAEHIEALRLGRTPPADTSHRIITSPAAARLREIGVAEADIRCAATPVHGPTLVAARDDRGLRLTPVLPTWQPAAGAR
ncbi:MAG: 2-phosphosulfolactate phosphatase [Actinomycetota bacterium]